MDSNGPAAADEPVATSATGAIPETTTTTPADDTPASAPLGVSDTSAASGPAVSEAHESTADSPLVAHDGASTSKLGKESVGTTISLEGFGGKVTRHDGVEVTMKELLEGSGSGVVVFTYPKASTPGCKSILSFLPTLLLCLGCECGNILVDMRIDNCLGTTQACLFRDSYGPITGASLAVYGLSTDSGKANTTFVNKNSLPYPLLVSCLSFPFMPKPLPSRIDASSRSATPPPRSQRPSA